MRSLRTYARSWRPVYEGMSDGERKPRTRWRWPHIQEYRRMHNRAYRRTTRYWLRRADYEAIDPPRRSSAKWEMF